MSSIDSSVRAEVAAVHAAYLRLAQGLDGVVGLGGKLLYAGELDEAGCILVRAANIAGAASLSATSDPGSQRKSIREGVVDFFVTNLDEALRILKNEVRKRQPVSVGVGVAPETLQAEMKERGVVADLLRGDADGCDSSDPWCSSADGGQNGVLVEWSVAAAPALWLPKIDAMALGCLPGEAVAQHRWLHLAPRYLGRTASHFRMLRAGTEFATAFVEKLRRAEGSETLAVAAHVVVCSCSGMQEHHLNHT